MQLVDPALERAAGDGPEAAESWIAAQNGTSEAKARALAELAHWVLDNDPDTAGRIALDAAALSPGDPRLFPLAIRLYETGLVAAPARLCATIRDHLTLSDAQLRTCDYIAEDAALLNRGVWEMPPRSATDDAVRETDLAILCAPRWAASPQIAAARAAASAAGMSVAVIDPTEKGDLSCYACAHIFVDTLAMACALATDACAAGCQILVDLAHPPLPLVKLPDSERAKADSLRLRGLGGGADAILTRSRSMARHLDTLGVEHSLVNNGDETAVPQVSDEAVAAALTEYGARPGVRTIGCIATLDADPGLQVCLESFNAITQDDEAVQLIIFGRGSGSASPAREARRLGIDDRVHFVGLPPPARWPALLAACDFLLAPRFGEEVLGSETGSIMEIAIGLGRPLLATRAGWDAQAIWNADAVSILPDTGEWHKILRKRLDEPESGRPIRAKDGISLAAVYQSIFKV